MGALVLAVFFKFNLAAFHFGLVHWQHSLWQAKRVYIFMWSPGRWRLLRLRNGVEKDGARRQRRYCHGIYCKGPHGYYRDLRIVTLVAPGFSS
jgi:hypothetical protein